LEGFPRGRSGRQGQGFEIDRRMELAADAQTRNQSLIAFRTPAAQVIQQPSPPRDHLQQTSARMMIFRMRREVLLKLQNSPAQDSHLYFWRPGIRLMDPELRDNFSLCFASQCHSRIDTPRQFLIVTYR
jgi:hypothetical protein